MIQKRSERNILPQHLFHSHPLLFHVACDCDSPEHHSSAGYTTNQLCTSVNISNKSLLTSNTKELPYTTCYLTDQHKLQLNSLLYVNIALHLWTNDLIQIPVPLCSLELQCLCGSFLQLQTSIIK
jgi:hypothetical protein